MWLGSSQQVRQIDIVDIPVISTQVKVVDSACDLGGIVNSQRTVSARRYTMSSWFSSAPTVVTSCLFTDCQCRHNTSPGIHFMSPGLLQFIALRRVRQPYLESGVSPQCHWTSRHQSSMMLDDVHCTSYFTLLLLLWWYADKQYHRF